LPQSEKPREKKDGEKRRETNGDVISLSLPVTCPGAQDAERGIVCTLACMKMLSSLVCGFWG
jgi:hypothetical protein